MNYVPQIGMDIGTFGIKLVELVPNGKDKLKMTAAATAPAPMGGIAGNLSNLPAISQLIVKLVKESGAKTKRVVASLPEDQVSTHVLEMPMLSDKEINDALKWQVEQYIPIPLERATWSHQIINKNPTEGTMEILLVASAKNLVDGYIQVLEKAGLEVAALETELVAASRSQVNKNIPVSMILEIGFKYSAIGVVRSGSLVFSRTIPTAAESLRRAIETTLGMDPNQAEEYKNTYGLDTTKLEGKLSQVMEPVLKMMTDEVKKTISFYENKHQDDRVKVVTLTGGSAILPELATKLSGLLGLEVTVGNPFEKNKIGLTENQMKAIGNSGSLYGVATGLAMREYD